MSYTEIARQNRINAEKAKRLDFMESRYANELDAKQMANDIVDAELPRILAQIEQNRRPTLSEIYLNDIKERANSRRLSTINEPVVDTIDNTIDVTPEPEDVTTMSDNDDVTTMDDDTIIYDEDLVNDIDNKEYIDNDELVNEEGQRILDILDSIEK